MARARSVALRKGYADDADDFASWAVERWLSGKREKSTINQLFIDYLRDTYGDLRHELGKLRSDATRYAGVVAESDISDNPTVEQKIDAERFLATLQARERAIIVLYYWYGFGLKEIAFCVGLSAPRVHELLNVIIGGK